ncbi:metallophosphoesterase family protein [Bacillus sp. SD088]|uniref:metallophosphoesterase family protein n=1 Tax=Bacillus sp. SD088 TaxID=2782012 RepID=UPI001A95C9F2|nr:metallophosphoesterase [Bacillus sp. SD088]MBO0991502.1 metallophosphoesterase [Bacillus sp. SD088]
MGNVNQSDESAILEFFIISDFQLTAGNERSHEKLKMGLEDLKSIHSAPDALVVNGDMTDDGGNESYAKVLEIMEEAFHVENTLFAIGNHEFFKNDGNEPSIKRFLNFAGRDQIYDEIVVKGYPFILLGTESWGPVGTPTKDSAVLGDEQLHWLVQTLKKYETSRRPIFVFLHQPLPYTLTGTDLKYYSNGVIQDMELKRILSQYPQVILFSGHSHWDLRLPGMFLQNSFSMANSGAIYNTYGPGEEGHEVLIDPDGSQGLYVQVFEEKVIIRPRDIAKKEWIENTFTLPTALYK